MGARTPNRSPGAGRRGAERAPIRVSGVASSLKINLAVERLAGKVLDRAAAAAGVDGEPQRQPVKRQEVGWRIGTHVTRSAPS